MCCWADLMVGYKGLGYKGLGYNGLGYNELRYNRSPVIISSSAPSSYPSRVPAKGRELEWARILCNCGRT